MILALFVRTFIVQAFKIPTGSMENNLLIGDHLLVNKFSFAPARSRAEAALLPIDEISRGDIIVFKYPEEPERDFIKRVIGLPGETLELRNKKVYIDDTPLDEPYVRFLFPPDDEESTVGEALDFDVRKTYGPVTVPDEHYFMMGDNRDNLTGQSVLGIPAPRIRQGTSAVRVFFIWGRARGTVSVVHERPLG